MKEVEKKTEEKKAEKQQINLNKKIYHPNGVDWVFLGAPIVSGLESSAAGGNGLKKAKLAKTIRGRMEKDQPMGFTSSESSMIIDAMKLQTAVWAFEPIIRELDYEMWKREMLDEKEEETKE